MSLILGSWILSASLLFFHQSRVWNAGRFCDPPSSGPSKSDSLCVESWAKCSCSFRVMAESHCLSIKSLGWVLDCLSLLQRWITSASCQWTVWGSWVSCYTPIDKHLPCNIWEMSRTQPVCVSIFQQEQAMLCGLHGLKWRGYLTLKFRQVLCAWTIQGLWLKCASLLKYFLLICSRGSGEQCDEWCRLI